MLVEFTFNRGISSCVLCTAEAQYTEKGRRGDDGSTDRHRDVVSVVSVSVVVVVVTDRRKGEGIGTKGIFYTHETATTINVLGIIVCIIIY